MNSKVVTAFIVATVAIVAIPMAAVFDESDAALGTATGEYTVFYYESSEDVWNSASVSTYDAAQAIQASGFWMSDDTMISKTTGGDYPSPNYNYGDISTFRGITESGDDVWNVLVYQNDAWISGSPYLGWYTCFSDQPGAWKTANIALYYGTSASADSMIQSLNSFIDDEGIEESAITEISHATGSPYQFTFYLKVSYASVSPEFNISGNVSITTEDLAAGRIITAYGSNAYLALKWAFGTNLSAVEEMPGIHSVGDGYDYWTYYSWMNSLFGLGTIQTGGSSTPSDWSDDSYAYWCIYTGHTQLGDEVNSLADYVIGQYAPLSCATTADNTIALVYEEVPSF